VGRTFQLADFSGKQSQAANPAKRGTAPHQIPLYGLPKFLSDPHGENPSFLRKQESSFFSGFPPSRERRALFGLPVSRVNDITLGNRYKPPVLRCVPSPLTGRDREGESPGNGQRARPAAKGGAGGAVRPRKAGFQDNGERLFKPYGEVFLFWVDKSTFV